MKLDEFSNLSLIKILPIYCHSKRQCSRCEVSCKNGLMPGQQRPFRTTQHRQKQSDSKVAQAQTIGNGQVHCQDVKLIVKVSFSVLQEYFNYNAVGSENY